MFWNDEPLPRDSEGYLGGGPGMRGSREGFDGMARDWAGRGHNEAEHLLGALFGATLLAVLVGLAIWLVLRYRRNNPTAFTGLRPGGSAGAALNIAQERLARGEINTAQFAEIRDALLAPANSQPAPSPSAAHAAVDAVDPVDDSAGTT